MDRMKPDRPMSPPRKTPRSRRTRLLAVAAPVTLALGSLNSIVGAITAALGLGLVIFLHELGHFAVAKWCGVKVERFSIGFGPALLAKTYGETEYALCWLPLGGYVKMLGQDDADTSQMTDEDIRSDPRSYTNKTVPQRMAIISAGVIMNIITGTMFFAVAYGMGVKEATPEVGSVGINTPAWREGMRVGDRIVEINGTPIGDFTDIIRGTALSAGDLEVSAVSPTGDRYVFETAPDESGRRRQLGIGPMMSLQLVRTADTVPYYEGTAADGVEAQNDDRIVSVDGEPVANYLGFMDALASRRSEAVTLGIEHVDGSTSELTLPPQRKRALGFQVDLGKIASVRKGSVGDREKLAVGDRIVKVDGRAVGNDLDPLDLPGYFAERAGQAVTVTVAREEDGEIAESDLSITPRASKPWLYPSFVPGSAMAIPSLGVTAPLIPTVLAVEEGLIAQEAGIQPSDSLLEVTFDEGTPFDALGGAAKTLDVGTSGWAYLHHLIQMLPARPLTLKVNDAATGKTRIVTLPPEAGDDFLVSDRGLRLYKATNEVKADGLPMAAAMGTTKTVESVQDIYLTLRRLFGGQLSPLELAGPISIAQMGYQVAKNSFADFLVFLGFLSVNLAVINFLPIPVLDGGHMVFLLWEGITRKPPSEKVVLAASMLGLCLVLGLMLFVIGLDVTKTLDFLD